MSRGPINNVGTIRGRLGALLASIGVGLTFAVSSSIIAGTALAVIPADGRTASDPDPTGSPAAAGPISASHGGVRREPRTLEEARTLESDRIGMTSPVGLAFAWRSKSFYVVRKPGRRHSTGGMVIAQLRPFALRPETDRVDSVRIADSMRDAINIAFDDRQSRLLLLSDDGNHLLTVKAGPHGTLDASTLVRHDVRRYGLTDPQGIAVDPAGGTLFVLDRDGPRLVRIEPGVHGGFARATPSEVALPPQFSGARGLAFDPSSGHLQVGGPKTLYEVTTSGRRLATHSLSGTRVGTPQGMALAPSGDLTDPSGRLSLYVADSGGRRQELGQIVELSTTAAPNDATTSSAATSSFTSSLVHTEDTGAWSPPSPDPSGLAWLSGTPENRIMVVDGEVEETVGGITHFKGANVWEMTPSGSVLRTANISKVAPTAVPMSNEPTGVAYDAGRKVYFFTDDGPKGVFRLFPGADGLVGTSDDSWTFFDVTVFNNGDPEGIAYDSAHDRLFVADGVNAEVYQYTTTGSLVGHFDVAAFGVQDPESVEYNPTSGTLFVLSNRQSGPIIVETSLTGTLLQTIDVSAAGARKPAGLAYAPASNGSGAMRFYVADRGVDNNSDPTAVDGKIYEMTAPAGVPANSPPVITSDGGAATASVSAPENQSAVTDVDASDPDGDPLTYALAGGADASAFAIDPASGVLTFGTAPDFEAPSDSNGDNVYLVTVSVSDGRGGSDSQQLSVTVTNVDEKPKLYFSLRNAATVGGLTVSNEDIVAWDGSGGFALAFDGSDVGLSGYRIDAFAWLDADTLLFSVDADRTQILTGIANPIDDSDIVRFDATSLGNSTAGTFSMYLDGSDVGLTAAGHDVDAIELLPDGRVAMSTSGAVSVSGLSAQNEDILAFAPTALGEDTAGTFSMYFDGSDVGLDGKNEDLDEVSVDEAGKLYLSTRAAFAVAGVSGGGEDVFVFDPTSLGSTTTGTYESSLFFDGSSFGLAGNNLESADFPAP